MSPSWNQGQTLTVWISADTNENGMPVCNEPGERCRNDLDVSDADSDGDRTPVCFDEHTDNSSKITAHLCSCDTPKTDLDGDEVLECIDICS